MRARDLSASYATRNRYRLIGIFNKHNGIHYLSYLIDSEGHLFQSRDLRVINVQETHPCRITHAAGQLTWLRSVMRVQCTSLRDHGARIIAFFSFFLLAVYRWKCRHCYADTANKMQNDAIGYIHWN